MTASAYTPGRRYMQGRVHAATMRRSYNDGVFAGARAVAVAHVRPGKRGGSEF